MTLYEVLGVPGSASETDLKKAYRAMSLALHPDKNPLPEAEEAFKTLGDAWSTLSDPDKRREYDANLRRAAATKPTVKPTARPTGAPRPARPAGEPQRAKPAPKARGGPTRPDPRRGPSAAPRAYTAEGWWDKVGPTPSRAKPRETKAARDISRQAREQVDRLLRSEG